MGNEVEGMTRQKDISSKKEGRAIKEDYILTFFFHKVIYFLIILKT